MSEPRAELAEFNVIVKFGKGIPAQAQGVAMLALERHLRDLTGAHIEVFKETMADDSKLRRSMTTEQRAVL